MREVILFTLLLYSGLTSGSGTKCFEFSCYKFYEEGKTWVENQKTCKDIGGDLVSMETEAKWKYVNSEIQQINLPGGDEWHIGLKKQESWKWVSGKPLTIEKWQANEPSGYGNVAVMSKDFPPGSQGLFNDINGQVPRPFICEMPEEEKPSGSTVEPPEGPTTLAVGQPSNTSQPSGGVTEGMTEFEKDCLKAHNEYRAKHGVPPLQWSVQLAADAQKWANYLTVINRQEHDRESIEQGSGENLAYFQPGDPSNMPTQCQGPKTASCVQCREMVADWYSEESDFDYDTGETKGGVIAHFTQIIWKATTEL